MDLDPEETVFDTIVLGTGLIESITAGALARSGRKVLHLDQTAEYGGQWRVFHFHDLLEWIRRQQCESMDEQADPINDAYTTSYHDCFKNVAMDFDLGILKGHDEDLASIHLETVQDIEATLLQHVNVSNLARHQDYMEAAIKREAEFLESCLPSPPISESIKNLRYIAHELSQSRHYNIDLVPKITRCRGNLVDTLIRSGVGQYLEFMGVEGVYIWNTESSSFATVPMSKEDVFTNTSINRVDKHRLMKFLKAIMNYAQDPSSIQVNDTVTFDAFLQDEYGVKGSLRDAIVYAIALADVNVSAKEGLERTCLFMSSVGRFHTPSIGRFVMGAYLATQYGGGSEIAQAFCRVCAVYGGIYILNQPIDRLTFDEATGKCTGVITVSGKHLKGNQIVASIDYVEKSQRPKDKEIGTWISRTIVITNQTLAPHSETLKKDLAYSVIPSQAFGNASPIYILHVDHSTMTCPKDRYLTYLWTEGENQDCLREAARALVKQKDNVQALFVVHYQQLSRNARQGQWQLASNVIPCSDPNASLDFEDAMNEAMQIFHDCAGQDEVFLPASTSDDQD